MESTVDFYKEDAHPGEDWINKEYLVQLNLTGDCPCDCDFCYMKEHRKDYLSLVSIKKLWENLKKYRKENDIEYRVNLTGGDIFSHPEWKEIAMFVRDEESITAVDPLINRFWNKEQLELLKILKDKINFVQLNSDIVKEEDIVHVKDIGKNVVLKISLYKGDAKTQIKKIKRLTDKYGNIIVSIDLIIPQKCAPGKKENYLIFDYDELKDKIKSLKNIFGDRLWLLSCTVKRIFLNEIYYCPIPFGGVYIMPDERVVPCSRYSHLSTGYNIDNFDLMEYNQKFNSLCSNFCLFENKNFKRFWDDNQNPIKFFEDRI